MQSTAAVRSVNRLQLLLRQPPHTCAPPISRALSATPFKAGDRAVRSEDPQGEEAKVAAKAAATAAAEHQKSRAVHADASKPPPTPTAPADRSPKLEHSEVGPPVDPTFQQKRRRSHLAAPEDVGCVSGWDAGWPERRPEGDVEDYREYYEKHKPSPLSEIEVADTRRPIRRETESAATGRVDAGYWGGGGGPRGLMVEDTVDDSLRRAEEMFREAAARGDPESPHGTALRRMLWERYQRAAEKDADYALFV